MLIACCGLRHKATSARENKWSGREACSTSRMHWSYFLFLIFMATVSMQIKEKNARSNRLPRNPSAVQSYTIAESPLMTSTVMGCR